MSSVSTPYGLLQGNLAMDLDDVSGVLGAPAEMNFDMPAYSIFPAMGKSAGGTTNIMRMQFRTDASPAADALVPQFGLWNPSGGNKTYRVFYRSFKS